jgi:hypothetical protein
MIVKRQLAAFAVMAACGSSPLASAAAPDYDYVSAGLSHTQVPGTALDSGRGYFVDVDWQLPQNVLVGAAYSRQKFDGDETFFLSPEVMKDNSLSVGYKFTLADNVALAARLVHDMRREEIEELSGFTFDYYYDGLSFELRDQVSDHLELHGGFAHYRGDGVTNVVNLGVLYPIIPLFALGADVVSGTFESNDTTVKLFARFQF